MKALVAMSGGVDSSVAAALLVEQGHDVVGVTFEHFEGPTDCCSLDDREDARRVAEQLGIAFRFIGYSDVFRREVVDRFGAAYLDGRTPNPCIDCNRRVRFPMLLAEADRLGCDVVVTGHYARVCLGVGGARHRLLRGVDPGKDQSYVLYALGQAELGRVRLPIGGLTKAETRRMAERLGLRTAHKRDSQDTCFVAGGDLRGYLRQRYPEAARPGEIVDTAGRVLGTHDGAVGYTLGQRRGLGVASTERLFVVAVDPESATVTLGRHEDLLAGGCRLDDVVFVAGEAPRDRVVGVKIRYRSPAAPARLDRDAAGVWTVRFDAPLPAVTPGQAAVLYHGDACLGGGTIAAALPV